MLRCVALGLMLCSRAQAVDLFRTPGYQAPVHGGPGDLLWLPGAGFRSTDRVEYQGPRGESGAVPIVALTAAQGAVVHLPDSLRAGLPYALTVVSADGERSAPVVINDPRPQWLSPPAFPGTAALPGAGRILRVIGRNLGLTATPRAVRLLGPRRYTLQALPPPVDARSLPAYVIEVALPAGMPEGSYRVSVRVGGSDWTEIRDQRLQILPEPSAASALRLDDPRFGGCVADSARSSTPCLLKALQAAAAGAGHTVFIPPGTWRLSMPADADPQRDGFVVPARIAIAGSRSAGRRSVLRRTDPLDPAHHSPLFTLLGHNRISDLDFSDDAAFTAPAEARPILRLGPLGAAAAETVRAPITDIAIAGNHFDRVGVGIMDEGGWPLQRLLVVHNEFAAFSDGLELAGGLPRPGVPFRIDDSVFRWNRFDPGRYTDPAARQGPIASQLGAAHRVDFSDNRVDGTSRRALADPRAPGGFRAGFFWNLSNNLEQLLVSRNQLLCTGDRDGDGEAVAFDADRGAENGLPGAPALSAAGPDWVSLDRPLSQQSGKVDAAGGYYVGYWLQILSGRGLGQVRRVVGYEEDPRTHGVRLRIAPAWDVIPEGGAARASVSRLGWQLLVIDNDIDSGAPPCRKSNLTAPNGGQIGIWASSADSVIDGNRQRDSSGIQFLMSFKDVIKDCPECDNSVASQAALEIQNNDIDGEYDWDSACSVSGILGYYAAVPDPATPPPILATAVSIGHNRIRHADGPLGGAIDFFPGWFAGPPPGLWTLALHPLIFGNRIADVDGAPTRQCRFPASERVGIRLGEHYGNVSGAVLVANECRRVGAPLHDQGANTVRLCPQHATQTPLCECGG